MSGSVPPGPAPVRAGAGAGGVSSAARASSTEAASAAACVVLREGTAPDHPRQGVGGSGAAGGQQRLIEGQGSEGVAWAGGRQRLIEGGSRGRARHFLPLETGQDFV